MPRSPLSVSFALALIASLAGVAGCGRSSDPTATGPLPVLHACGLMMLEDADPEATSDLLKARALVDTDTGTDMVKCTYSSMDNFNLVSLEVRRFASVERARRAQEASLPVLKATSSVKPAPIIGLGDEAVWAGGGLSQIHERLGAYRLILTVDWGGKETRQAVAERLAHLATDRLRAALAAPPPAAATPTPKPQAH